MQSTNVVETKSFARILEEEWVTQSEELEENHFDAAFEAKVAENEVVSTGITEVDSCGNHGQIRPNKSNFYSPYVPSSALRIQGMIDFTNFNSSDVFCDMGCGDGRVCLVVAAAQFNMEQRKVVRDTTMNVGHSFRSIGIDVAKDCIDAAQKHLMTNQYLSPEVKQCIQFYQADLTIDPNKLLNETSQLRNELTSVTVIYLYTYPTLLIQLLPLLSHMFQVGRLRAVVTLTYHIHHLNHSSSLTSGELDWRYKPHRVNEEHDLCLYSNPFLQSITKSDDTDAIKDKDLLESTS